MSNQTARAWRSLLYVPANSERFIAKAQERGADALILDLEDSVPEDRKAEARETLRAHWPALSRGPSALTVRINSGIRAAIADLEAAVQPGLSAVFMAKCDSPEKSVMIAEVIAELEAERGIEPGSIATVPMIEDPASLSRAEAIACSHPRVCALLLGSEDFATACEMEPGEEQLSLAKRLLVFAARAAGVVPLGLMGSVAGIAGDDYIELVRRSKSYGFGGATAIHPAAIVALNAGFSPSDEERAWATAVRDAMALATAEGRGAARLNDKMIDKPVLLRAMAILERAGLH